VYWWADGIYTTLREEDDDRLCLLVISGVTPEDKKEWVAIICDGFRESTESWLDVLRDLKERGLSAPRNWPSATAPWVSGAPWSRSIPKRATSAADFTRWAIGTLGAAQVAAQQSQDGPAGDLDGKDSQRG